jgi:putative methionine-R-sulfoxide reductase with GAF domain
VYRFDDLVLVISAASPADRNLVLGLEMGDVVLVTRTFSTGSPAQVSDEYGIERIVHQITPDRHIVSLGLYVAEIVFPFVLDDAVFGLLDTDNALV